MFQNGHRNSNNIYYKRCFKSCTIFLLYHDRQSLVENLTWWAYPKCQVMFILDPSIKVVVGAPANSCCELSGKLFTLLKQFYYVGPLTNQNFAEYPPYLLLFKWWIITCYAKQIS